MAEISKGRKIVSRFEQLRNEKNLYEFEFQDIAEFMAPNKANFTKTFSPGLNRRERLFDSTAERALGIFAASLMAFLVNPATRWFDLKTLNPEANKIHDNAVWLDFASQRLLNAFNEPNARFYGHMFRALTDIGAFGNAGMFTLEGTVTDLAFRALPLSELYFLENSEGVVNTKYRLISMSFRQTKLADAPASKNVYVLAPACEAFTKVVVVSPALSAAVKAILPLRAPEGNISTVPAVPERPASKLVILIVSTSLFAPTITALLAVTVAAETPLITVNSDNIRVLSPTIAHIAAPTVSSVQM